MLTKERVELLGSDDVTKKEYDKILNEISTTANEIWRYICKQAGRKMEWWAFRNDMSYGHGDGSDGGSFDPEEDSEFIETAGECTHLNNDFYEYNEGFPTRFLWEEGWKAEVDAHTNEAKKELEKSKIEKKKKAELSKVKKKETVQEVKNKLKKVLTPEELKVVKFK